MRSSPAIISVIRLLLSTTTGNINTIYPRNSDGTWGPPILSLSIRNICCKLVDANCDVFFICVSYTVNLVCYSHSFVLITVPGIMSRRCQNVSTWIMSFVVWRVHVASSAYLPFRNTTRIYHKMLATLLFSLPLLAAASPAGWYERQLWVTSAMYSRLWSLSLPSIGNRPQLPLL